MVGRHGSPALWLWSRTDADVCLSECDVVHRLESQIGPFYAHVNTEKICKSASNWPVKIQKPHQVTTKKERTLENSREILDSFELLFTGTMHEAISVQGNEIYTVQKVYIVNP